MNASSGNDGRRHGRARAQAVTMPDSSPAPIDQARHQQRRDVGRRRAQAAGIALAGLVVGVVAWFGFALRGRTPVSRASVGVAGGRAESRCAFTRRMRTLATALDHAEFLRDQCAPRAAANVLRPALSRFDPAAGCTDRLVVRAAVVYAETAFDTPASQLAYARFAEDTSRTVYGLADPLALAAMTAAVAVAVQQDLHADAITVCGRLVAAYTERGEHADALTWRRERAALLHSDGKCDQALDDVVACMALTPGLPPADRRTAARHALIQRTVILAGCGGATYALTLLQQHNDLLPTEGSTDRHADEAAIAAAIHAVTATHPAVCTRTRTPEPAAQRPLAFWTTAVREAARAGARGVPSPPARRDLATPAGSPHPSRSRQEDRP